MIGVRTIRRTAALLLCAMLVTLSACTSSAVPSEAATRDRSIERLCKESAWTVEMGEAVLARLQALGFEGEVILAYPAGSGELAYTHVWMGERTADVYLDADGSIGAVVSGGVTMYGRLPEPAVSEPESEPDSSELPETEAPETEVEEPTEHTLSLVAITERVAVGDKVELRAQGRAGECYRIEVRYKSGVSEAEGLEPQTVDEDGALCWTWTVGSRVAAGSYTATLIRTSDERDRLELRFEVIPRAEQ